MSELQEQSNLFAFAWAQGGFETIVNLTIMDERAILAKLADEKAANTPSRVMHYLKLRAAFNQARRYEVWLMNVDQGITEDDLWEWANSDPQGLVDIIRERGSSYSTPAPTDGAVIR